jgi:cytochrome c-type biogenesis protein CcmH
VVDFLVARYGEFVLLKPRFERQTLLLWLVPPLLLIGGGLGLWLHIRRRVGSESADAVPPLTADEEARLSALMTDGTESEKQQLDRSSSTAVSAS